MTNRQYDINGFLFVKDNPISKVGVFEYSGASIPGADHDKTYYVYRPEEELSDPDCLDSFKLQPFTDEHEMLGNGATPAEEKGVDGTIGEQVYFEYPYIKANLKVFSEKTKSLINKGKDELSCGYRCIYEKASGVFEGQSYDYIQRKIRGNHLALVGEGRMGADVAVLDHFKFTVDSKEIIEMAENNSTEKKEDVGVKSMDMTPEEKAARIAELEAELQALKADPATDQGPEVKDPAKDAEPEKTAETATQVAQQAEQVAQVAEAVAEQAEQTSEQAQAIAAAIDPEKINAAMDAKIKEEVQKVVKAREKDLTDKNALYDKVSPIVGAFDHSIMSSSDLAAYACKKLGMSIEKGQEKAALNGFLAAYKAPKESAVAQDGGATLSCLKSIGA